MILRTFYNLFYTPNTLIIEKQVQIHKITIGKSN